MIFIYCPYKTTPIKYNMNILTETETENETYSCRFQTMKVCSSQLQNLMANLKHQQLF